MEEVNFHKKIGDPVLVPPEGYEFLGWMTVSGDNPIDAQDNIRRLFKFINFEVAKYNRSSFIGRTSRKNRFSAASLNKELLLRAAKIENIRRIPIGDLRGLKLGIAYNTFKENENELWKEAAATARSMEETLRERRYEVTLIDFNDLPETFERLRESDTNLVLNVRARVPNSTFPEANATTILDILNIPYTGSDTQTLQTCSDGIMIRKLLSFHGIPTPKWEYTYAPNEEIREDLRYPLVVKPARKNFEEPEDEFRIVKNQEELKAALERITTQLNLPALIEEFREGDEYDAIIVGNEDSVRVLPLSRTIFQNLPEGTWPTSAISSNGEYAILQRPPKNISKKLETLLTEIALDAYSVLECKDIGLVKMRVDKDQNPYIIRINPSPILGPKSCAAEISSLLGMNYGDLLEDTIRIAIQRYKT